MTVTVAGIEISGGRRVWADCAPPLEVHALDCVRVCLGESVVEGIVFLAPEECISGDMVPDGKIVSVIDPAERSMDGSLPGADMPVLGSQILLAATAWAVLGVDPVRRVVTLTRLGEQVTIPVSELEGNLDAQ